MHGNRKSLWNGNDGQLRGEGCAGILGQKYDEARLNEGSLDVALQFEMEMRGFST